MEQKVEDKAPKPKGLMPKNVQALVIAGIALLMIVIMVLTGHKRPKMPQASQTPPPVSATAVDPGKIANLQKDIQQEQIQSAPAVEAVLLQQQRNLAAQKQLSNPYGTPVTGASPNGAYPPGAYAAASQPATAPPPDPVKEEARKRRYQSLFAGNVALSYRKDAPGMETREAQQAGAMAPVEATSMPGPGSPFQSQQQLLNQEGAELQQEEQMLEQAQAAGLVPKTRLPHPLPSRGEAGKTGHSIGNNNQQSDPPNPYVAKPGEFNYADGKTYVLFEGTVIQTLLVNRLEGSFAGPVTCMVTNNVYSRDRQHLLIPAGSKVLGEARKVDTFGQARLPSYSTGCSCRTGIQ